MAGFAIERYRAARPMRVYQHEPIEQPGGRGPRVLLVTPTKQPAVP